MVPSKPEGGKKKKWTWMIDNSYTVFAFVLFVLFSILTFASISEGLIALQCSAQPEDFSLKDLLARGREGNPHVRVGGFAVCDKYVHKTNNKSPGWTQVWIPVVPVEEAIGGGRTAPTPEKIKCLFFSTSISNARELESRLGREQVEGLVNTRTTIGGDVRRLLQDAYPGTDLDKCLIFQEGRAPFSRGLLCSMAAGAVISLLAAGVLFVIGIVKARVARAKAAKRLLRDRLSDPDESPSPKKAKKRSADRD
jgi:hypothetical protein